MASKTNAAERRSADTEQTALPTQARQQMASLTESAASFYKSLEALQQVHQHAAQRSALRLQQAAEQLRSSDSAAEWMSIQSTLMLGGMQEWTQYLQELSLTMMRVQSQMVSKPEAGQSLDGAGVPGADTSARQMNAASAAADATSAATLAVLKSWTNMMGGGLPSADSRATH
jgi:hypothetical protein